MHFGFNYDPGEWTMDDSIPLEIYADSDELINVIYLNKIEVEDLYETIQGMLFNLLKWKDYKSKYLVMTKKLEKELKEYKEHMKRQKLMFKKG